MSDPQPLSPRNRRLPTWLWGAIGIVVLAVVVVIVGLMVTDDDEGHSHKTTSGRVANTPDAVAKAYVAAFNDRDIAAMKRHVCQASVKALTSLEASKQSFGGSGLTLRITGAASASEDKATVPIRVQGADPGGAPPTLEIIRSDGDWKVCSEVGQKLGKKTDERYRSTDACSLVTADQVASLLGGERPAGVREDNDDRPTCVWKAKDGHHQFRLYVWSPPLPEIITGGGKRTLTISGKPAYVRAESGSVCELDIDAGPVFLSGDLSFVGQTSTCSNLTPVMESALKRLTS